jgi:hypothetical protein
MTQKIVFFDIDGTLYDSKLGVPESTKKGISELIDNGHIPIICTGRTKSMIPMNLLDMGFFGVVAGAGTYVEYNGEVVHHKILEANDVKDLLILLKENNIKYIVEGPEYVYYDKTDDSEEYGYVKNVIKTLGEDRVKPLDESNYQLNKITCAILPNSNLEAVLPEVEKMFHLIRHQGAKIIELAPIGYDKSTGIEKLIEYLGINKIDTYAFGDSTNDIEMLEYVEYGIAMGNSYPEVLEKAKYKTKSIEDDGIYAGLKTFGLIYGTNF